MEESTDTSDSSKTEDPTKVSSQSATETDEDNQKISSTNPNITKDSKFSSDITKSVEETLTTSTPDSSKTEVPTKVSSQSAIEPDEDNQKISLTNANITKDSKFSSDITKSVEETLTTSTPDSSKTEAPTKESSQSATESDEDNQKISLTNANITKDSSSDIIKSVEETLTTSKEDHIKTSSEKKLDDTTEYDPKNIHYEDELAIYTDPKSGYQFKWCTNTNQWLPKLKDSDSNSGETKEENLETKKESSSFDYDPKNVHYEDEVAIYTDSKTGYQYKWCKETSQWLPKDGITYGFEDDTHTYTDAEGVKYFWDKEKKAWFPKIDDDFMARYQMNYGFVDNATSEETKEEENQDDDDDDEEEEEERRVVYEKKDEVKGVKRKAEPAPPSWFEMNDQQNTKVYVSNLPTDITEQEFVDLMQKCGLVMRDMQTGKWKVKLYTVPETDILKGDGLCTYIKIESVELALNVLDDYFYRGRRIQVERAKFEMKGEYNPKLKPKKKRRQEKDKLKKMQQKLFDWRPEKMRGERSKHERVVIVRNLFESSIFDEDATLILEYQQDLREECSKCGEVKKVLLYDRHPEGVAQITMKDPEEADACVSLLNDRWFGQRKITAEIWDGKTKFKIAETDSEISKRINEWEKFLESDEKTEEKRKEEEKTIKDNTKT